MRVAYVCADTGIPVFGHKGSAVHVREMCAAQIGLGHKVTLLACGASGSPPTLLHGVDVVPLPLPCATETERREREAVALIRATHDALTAHGPFDLVYERAALWSVAGPRFAAQTGTPSVLEVNAPLVDEQSRYRALVHHGAAERLFARAVRLASIVSAVSAEVAASVATAVGVGEHVHVEPNGVASERFALASRCIRPRSDRFTVGFVGSLRSWHGVEHLVEAAALALPAGSAGTACLFNVWSERFRR